MSLVNDMLRDLDRRGAGRPGDPETDLQGASGKGTQGVAAQAPVWLWLLAGALLGAGALALAGFWSSPELTPDPENLKLAESAPPAGPAQAQLQTLDQALVLDPLAQQSGSDDEIADNAQDENLSRLLSQAEEARSRDRLTRPAGDNAYDYYQQVLIIEPGHPAARSGLAAIARRYTEMAETALDRNQLTQARQLIRRGLSVEPGHQGLQQSRERLEERISRRQSQADKGLAASQQAQESSEEELPEEESPEQDGQTATGTEPQMQVNLDAETQDRRAARRGRDLLAADDLTAARQHLQSSLRSWVGQDTPPVQTTQVLVDLYLLEGDYVSAEALLQASEALPKLVLHRLWAELEQSRGRPDAAIDWLESELPSAREDEHYRSLLARLYYTQGQEDKAAQSYSRLLADFGGRPAYWLGLGLARDAQDRDSEALEAFRRAQASGAYERNPEIADYLKRRIAALQRQTQASES